MKLNIQLFAGGNVLTIGTDLDTKKFEEKLSKLEARYDKEQIDLEVKAVNIENIKEEIDQISYKLERQKEISKQETQEIERKLVKYNELTEIMNKQGLDKLQAEQYGHLSNDLAGLKARQEEINAAIEQYNIKLGKANEKLIKAEGQYEKQLIRVQQTNKELQDVRGKISGFNFSGIARSINDIGKSVTKVTKKVGRWALAVFGIRSAYLFVRNAMSTLSQYDDQLAVNTQYIRYLLANTVAPVVEYIVNLAYTLLSVVRSIIKTITGYDILASASTDEFMKQQKAMGGTAKKAKELKKYLAGFDEMNVIPSTQDTNGGAGSGSKNKMPNFKEVNLQWLKNILPILAGIITALKLIRSGLGGIKALGIGIAVAGLLYTIKSIIRYIKNPTFNNFLKILKGIAITVAGVAIAFKAWPVAIGAALVLGVLLITQNLDKIKKLFDKLGNWLDKEFLAKLRKLFGPLGDILYLPIKYFYELGTNIFLNFYGGIKQWINGIMKLFQGDFIGGIKDIFGGLLNIMTAPLRGFITAVKEMFVQIKNTFMSIVDWVKTNIIDKISQRFDILKIDIENFFRWLAGKEAKYRTSGGGGSGSSGGGSGGGGRAKGGIYYPSKLPKLAIGGIINMPGRGIPYHGATIGERGAEAVVPLTDTQQMALLGEAIGRFVRIDNVIDVNMDSRKIKRIMATSDSRDRMVGNG